MASFLAEQLRGVHGQCAALLLWRRWTLVENRAVAPESLAKAVEVALDWEEEILRPLRALRQRLTTPSGGGAEAARAGVRRKILEAELEAEHALIDALEALQTPGGEDGGTSPIEAMTALAEAWRPPAPCAALARLIQAL